jgi:type I restriction enzyme S subunit
VTTSEVNYYTIHTTKEYITEAGLKNSSAVIFPRGTLLIALYGQGKTRGQVGILGIHAATNQACAAIIPNSEFDVPFLYYVLQWAYQRIRALSNSGGQDNLSGELVRQIRVPRPPLSQQLKIAEILRTWDEAIEKLGELRAAREQRIDGLRSGLLFGSLRLEGKRGSWQPRHLSEVTIELSDRNADLALSREAVMGVTNSRGIVPMREQTVAQDISRYKRLPPHAFAYNPMRINVGSIAMNSGETDILVSPDYVTFACKAGRLEPDYLNHLRKTLWWTHHITSGGSGSVRQRTYYDDLAALQLPLPDLDEQRRIVSVLNTASDDLTATDQMIDSLTRQKRGLAQKLLAGEWRVKVDSEKDAAHDL